MTCNHTPYIGPGGVRQCVKCKEPMAAPVAVFVPEKLFAQAVKHPLFKGATERGEIMPTRPIPRA